MRITHRKRILWVWPQDCTVWRSKKFCTLLAIIDPRIDRTLEIERAFKDRCSIFRWDKIHAWMFFHFIWKLCFYYTVVCYVCTGVVSFKLYIPQSKNANHHLSPQQVSLFTDGNILKYCKNYQNVSHTQWANAGGDTAALALLRAGLPQPRLWFICSSSVSGAQGDQGCLWSRPPRPAAQQSCG